MRHIKRKNEVWSKNANITFFIQNLTIFDKCAFAHYKIEIRRSTATSYKEKCSENSFDHDKIFFFTKSTKNVCFYQNHRMLNSNAFVLFKIKITTYSSTINKRKSPCIGLPFTARKNYTFIKKITKIQLFFYLKYTILDRFAFKSRNIEMINLEVIKK